jgi:hypothetical protein
VRSDIERKQSRYVRSQLGQGEGRHLMIVSAHSPLNQMWPKKRKLAAKLSESWTPGNPNGHTKNTQRDIDGRCENGHKNRG